MASEYNDELPLAPIANSTVSTADRENGGESHDDLLVTWEYPASSTISNPRSWPQKRKWMNMLIISAQTAITPITSTIVTPASLKIAEDFNITSTYVLNLAVAMFLLGLGIGPLFMAPVSEIYGRRAAYIYGFGAFLIFNIGCAVCPNMTSLAILRLATGLAGSVGPSIGGATIGDLFEEADRGKAQALYAVGPTTGPIIGGVIGGFIVYYTNSWRWCLWVMSIATGVVLTGTIIFLKETNPKVLLKKKAAQLRKETKQDWRPAAYVKTRAQIHASVVRPFHLLFTSPLCTVICLYGAVVYGAFYLHMVTVPLLFTSTETDLGLFSYRWPDSIVGLSYLGIGSGFISGTLFSAVMLNRTYRRMQDYVSKYSNADKQTSLAARLAQSCGTPEYRLPMMQLGALVVPIGLVIFAWSAEKRVHWIVPLIGAAIYAFGGIIIYVCVQSYIVDSYDEYAASAVAAMNFTRCTLACVFAIVGVQLYAKLDYGWGTMVLFFICLAMAPLPAALYVWGPGLRQRH